MSEWQPIETCPADTWVLVWASWEVPYVFVVRYKVITKDEDRLISEKGNRRTYETVEVQEREWEGGSWGGEFWMPLPAPPQSDGKK